MKKLVVTLGITGSGKSTLLNNKNPVVETDDLRIELLNNIDDISQERLIFNTAAKRISKLFGAYDTVYFGATLVNSKYRISFLQSIKDMCKHELVIDMVIFSCLPEVARERINKDLKAEIQRADSTNLLRINMNNICTQWIY